MSDETIEEFRARLKDKDFRNFAKQAATASYDNLLKWFLQIIAFAAASNVASAGLLTQATIEVWVPLLYLSIISSAWATLHSLWFLKIQLVENINKVSQIGMLIMECSRLGNDETSIRRLRDIQRNMTGEEGATLISKSPTIVMMLVSLSLLALVAAILLPHVLSFVQSM